MSAAIDVRPLEEHLGHLRRDHVTRGYVHSHLHEVSREMTVYIDNVDDLNQFAANLGLGGKSMIPNRWEGWYGEIRLTLCLDIPRGPFPAQDRRTV